MSPLSTRLWGAGLWLLVVLIFVLTLPPTVLISISTFTLISLLALPVFWLFWSPLPLPLPSSAPAPPVSSPVVSFSSPAVPPLLPFSSSSPASAPPPTSARSVATPSADFSHPALSSVWPGLVARGGVCVSSGGICGSCLSLSTSLPPSSYDPSRFRPFSAVLGPSAQAPPVSFAPLSSTPAAPGLAPSSAVSAPDSLFFGVPASSSHFVAPDELPLGAATDALPSEVDPAVPDSFRSEFRRMLAFLVDLSPQTAGSQSAPPPPRALFEDFFGSSAPHSPPIFLSWFERVRMALAEADSRLASFLSSGCSDFSFLPPWNSAYAVKGEFASGQAVPVNPSLLALYDRQLKPSYHVGLMVCEAAGLESFLRAQSEALSHAMWVLSGLLGFVSLQNFAPSDVTLFNTLVTSLSKSLAHQASLSASHTAFLVLKWRHFYLSHLPSYFSDSNKRSMLSAPAVCADFLFAEADVSRLLADTQTASSLKSQQALVDVVSRSAGSRSRCMSPRRSPGLQSPGRRRRDSGSPARVQKRVRFDSPAPNSALRSSKRGFRR